MMPSVLINTVLLINTALINTVFSPSMLLLARRRSQIDGGKLAFYLAITVGLILAVCAASYFGTRMRNNWRYKSPLALFLGLCQAHKLDVGSKKLLRQIAQQHKLDQPAQVFTDPQWIDKACVSGALRSQSMKLGILRERLFG